MVSYIEYAPPPALASLVETYWVLEGMVDSSISRRIMPDGCVDIIFDFIESNINRNREAGIPDIVGTMTTYFDLDYSFGEVLKIGIRFNPAAITAFTRVPVNEFTNHTMRLSMIESLFDESFHEQLNDRMTVHERLAYISNYLISLLPRLKVPEERIVHAVNTIKKLHGQITVARLSDEVCLCGRQFERRFKHSIGISPKAFIKVERFRHTQQYLKNNPEESMFSAALNCGYYDDSHLFKDFKVLGGILPTDITP